MAVLTTDEHSFLCHLSELAYCNPFLAERIELERKLLGADFSSETGEVWSRQVQWNEARANVQRLSQKVEGMAADLRQRVVSNPRSASGKELQLYEDLVLYLLYHRCWNDLQQVVDGAREQSGGPVKVSFWPRFKGDFEYFLKIRRVVFPSKHNPAHLLACFFQIRRAFHHIYQFILGRSKSATCLRASIWQSIFTHDMRRYRQSLYGRMGDITVLITGPSGTGKELVARAIGLSRYIPFQPARGGFVENYTTVFHALNPSALSPTLIESELFGHRRGAFTGAVDNRAGWLEICGAYGTVFLDEIGDVDDAIQVKLLRVLQSRTFQRLGETDDRLFEGKVIAATNRDLPNEIRTGRFRSDFYYRLCSDTITTPSLSEQLAESSDDLEDLVLFLADRVAGEAAEELAKEVLSWIRRNLQPDYPWPGNIRELEQCVRNVMIHKEYHPADTAEHSVQSESEALVAAMKAGSLTADELVRRYCALVYQETGSYEEAARRLKLDRRTVKSKVSQRRP